MKVGDIVGGRYEVEALLGTGGMGSVWRARHCVTDKRVALKTLLTDGEELRVRFLREARASCAVDHDNVVAVHDVFESADGTPVMVMDLLRGENLRERLLREPVLTERDALRILAPVVSAVRAAHAHGIVHRDLKPENVFLTTAGSVKVLDFGVAKFTHDPRSAGATESGAVIGTLLYMPPEQAFGEAIDYRADIWSLGVMLYEMLCGERPIEGTTMASIVRALMTPDIKPIRTRAPAVSSVLADLCGRMLRPDRADRPDLSVVSEVFSQLGHPPSDEGALGRVVVASAAAPGAAASDPLAVTALDSAARSTTSEVVVVPPPAAPVVPGRRRMIPAVTLGSLFGIAALVGVLRHGGAAHSVSPVPNASVGASPMAATEPVSANADARSAYERGVASLRGADWAVASASFAQALAADSTCAAAAIQVLLMAPGMSDSRTAYLRGLYRMAEGRRAHLSPRDQGFLRATEALLMRDPPDLTRANEELARTANAFPKDAEAPFFAAYFSEHDGKSSPGDTLAWLDRALAADPGYLDAMQNRSRALYQLGRTQEADAQLNACIESSPGSQCALERSAILANSGDCVGMEASARNYVAAGAGQDQAYDFEAVALAANGRPRDAVLEAIRQATQISPPALAYRERVLAANLDALRGDFRAAEQAGRDILASVESRPDARPHEDGMAVLAGVLGEVGSAATTSSVAEQYFARTLTWAATIDTHLGARRGSLALILALDATGAIPHADALERAHRWASDAVHYGEAPVRAAFDAAEVARTREEAESFDGTKETPLRRRWASDRLRTAGMQGHFLLVSGRTDEAVVLLKEATESCGGLAFPFVWVPSHLWLGQAYERQNNRELACKAYHVVVDRWGVQQPIGRTARAARARMGALHCP